MDPAGQDPVATDASPAPMPIIQPHGLPRDEASRVVPGLTNDGVNDDASLAGNPDEVEGAAQTSSMDEPLPFTDAPQTQPTDASPEPVAIPEPVPAAAPTPAPAERAAAPAGKRPVSGNGGQPVKKIARGEKGKKDNPNSTQNSLQIAEIRDGIVIMSDGSFRAVLMVKSINFDLMSPEEQEAVEYSYQGFLNSLYFPVQIYVQSHKVDLKPYMERMNKIRTEHDNMLLALLMEDYIGYIDNLSQKTNIMDKKFYVVIPFFPVMDTQKVLDQGKTFFSGVGGLFKPKEQHVTINEQDLENAKTELRNRVQSVLSGLLQCGVQGLPLDTQELIELYYDTYNPDTATRQQLKQINDLTVDIITKGEGKAPQAHLQRELQ